MAARHPFSRPGRHHEVRRSGPRPDRSRRRDDRRLRHRPVGRPSHLQLSVVSDDVEMKITHVVRGDDHISNTPKQMLLYQALGAPVPAFAHVPLILGADKKRLSKRHGATSVMEYARQGYLPEGDGQFPGAARLVARSGNQELFGATSWRMRSTSRASAAATPSSTSRSSTGSTSSIMLRLESDELVRRLRPWFEAAGCWDDVYVKEKGGWFFSVLELLKPRARKLDEFVELGRYFFTDQIEYDQAAVEKHLSGGHMSGHLQALAAAFAALPVFDPVSIETALRAVADGRNVKAAALIHAVRVAITGRSASPGLFEVAALLGRDRTCARLTAAGLPRL